MNVINIIIITIANSVMHVPGTSIAEINMYMGVRNNIAQNSNQRCPDNVTKIVLSRHFSWTVTASSREYVPGLGPVTCMTAKLVRWSQ